MAALLVGADIGTSACKASLLRADDGAVLASVTERYEPDTPRQRWSEQDPDAWYRAMVAAVCRLLAQRPDAAGDVRALGLAGQMRGVVLVDGSDRPMRPAVLWNDNRCDEEVAGIVGADLERLGAITHNVLNTMCTLPKLLWLQRHEPAALTDARTLLYPKDYVRLRLTGERATDLSDASGSSFYDVEAQAWSAELLDRYGIAPALLPRVLRATDIAGSLTETAAADTGLPPGLPVVAGGSDSTVESFSIGLTDQRSCKVRLGTSGAVSTVVDDIADTGRAYVWSFVRDDRWMLDTNTRACGGAVRWLRDMAYSEIERDEDAFAAIDRDAASIPVGAGGLLFHPYLLGEDAPYWDPTLRASFHGLEATHRRPHLARAVLEGTALALRDAMSTLGEWVPGFERSIFVGGGVLSPTWLAIVSDALATDGEVPEAADASLGGSHAGRRGCRRLREPRRERGTLLPDAPAHHPRPRHGWGLRRPLRALPRDAADAGDRVVIRVVGANPAMDRVSTWRPIRVGEVNRAVEVSVLPGGKGFNVARATVRLGCETAAYGFLGGHVGEALREMILADGIIDRHTAIAEGTRVCFIVVEPDPGRSTVLNEPGPAVDRGGDGPLPRRPADRLPARRRGRRSRAACPTASIPAWPVRSSPSATRPARAPSPTSTVRPCGTRPPAGRGCSSATAPSCWGSSATRPSAPRIRCPRLPARWGTCEIAASMSVVVTLGGDGALLADATGTIHARVPLVEVVNATGSGDLLLAGISAGIERGLPVREALVLGAACGTAGATHLAPELPAGFDADSWAAGISVEPVEPAG